MRARDANLGYPHVAHAPPLSKLPVRGQVTARDLDVAWLAQFNPRVESLGGRVTANAKLAGTLADPQLHRRRALEEWRRRPVARQHQRRRRHGAHGRRARPSPAAVGSRGRGVE